MLIASSLSTLLLPARTLGLQTMLTGEKQLVGSGFIRDVYLVEWEGRKLAVKFLREDYELRASEGAAESLHRWEEAALDAVSDPHVHLQSEVSAFPPCVLPLS